MNSLEKNQLERLNKQIENADAIVIGAGSGLSTAAGFVYNGERFLQYFSDFEAKYGFHDMYSGGFYPYGSLEEYWAYWSRYIYINRYMNAPNPVYDQLFSLVQNKDYFVITTNVDHCFQKAGFERKRLFYTQGDYGLFQCSEPCCKETFDNETVICQMFKQQKDMRIPTALLPVCPYCKKPLIMNLRSDNQFVEDQGWHRAAQYYEDFIQTRQNRQILFWELGVGYNTPSIIKYPFWRMTYQNPKAFYVCMNQKEAFAPSEIQERSFCIKEDIGVVLRLLQKRKGDSKFERETGRETTLFN